MIRRLVGNDFMDACYTFRAWYFRKCRRTWFEAVDTFRVIRFLVNRYEIVTVLVVLAIVYILLCGIASAAATHFSLSPTMTDCREYGVANNDMRSKGLAPSVQRPTNNLR